MRLIKLILSRLLKNHENALCAILKKRLHVILNEVKNLINPVCEGVEILRLMSQNRIFRQSLLTAVALVLLLSTPAQSQFVKTLGGGGDTYGWSGIEASDGEFVVTGTTHSFGAGSYDLLLAKFGASGNLLWMRTLGGTYSDYGYCVTQSSDGGRVVTGQTTSFGAGGVDLLLAKFDFSRNHLWTSTLGESDYDRGFSVIETSDGRLVVTGSTTSFGAGEHDLLLAKFDESGNLLWMRTLGGTYSDYGECVIEASDGGFVVTGTSGSFGAGDADLLLAKFDESGNLLWMRTLGGTGWDHGYCVTEGSDVGLVVSGYTGSFGAGACALLVAKFDSSGNLLWTTTLGGASWDRAYSCIETCDGGVVVTGHTWSFGAGAEDLILAKFDASGNHLWTRILGGTITDEGRSVIEPSDGGFLVIGRTTSFGAGGWDLLLARFDSSGNTCLGEFVTPTITSPSPTVTSPTPTVTTPSPTITSPSVTVTSPTPTITVVCEGYPFIRGDADGDGLVGMPDVTYIACYYAAGGPIPPCMDAADVNDDGEVDFGDAVYLVQYLGGMSEPPPPFPDPGYDPTPDDLDCANHWVDPAPSALDSLIVPSASGSPGETLSIPIVLRNSQDLLRYQINLEYDSTILEVVYVDTTGTATGAANPDHFDSFIPRGKVRLCCVVDCQLSGSIPAGRHTLVKIVFQVNAHCATTLLDLKDLTGPPFWGNLLDFSGGEVYPILVDSNFTSWSESPAIISITDVGNDQGRQARVHWYSSCYDDVDSPVTITEYGLWRRIDQDKGGNQSNEILSSDLGMLDAGRLYPPGDWDFIKTVPARGESTYNTVCPTLGDSIEAEGMYWSVFFVSAMTSDPLVYYDSEPDSGYSLDNIPPLPILDLEIDPNSWFTLQWTVPGEYPEERPISDYDLRYSTVPVGADTQAWWDSAEPCVGEGFFNFTVGERDSLRAAEETSCHPECYFAIKGLDERPNASGISNIVRFMCGDASSDGNVDVGDVGYLINYLFLGTSPPRPMAAGDVTCNGVVDIADVMYLINYLFTGTSAPCSS